MPELWLRACDSAVLGELITYPEYVARYGVSFRAFFMGKSLFE